VIAHAAVAELPNCHTKGTTQFESHTAQRVYCCGVRTPDGLHKATHRNFIIMTVSGLITTQNGTDFVSKEDGCHFARTSFLVMALILRSNTCFSQINEKLLSKVKLGGHYLYSSYRTRERGFRLGTAVSEQVQWRDFTDKFLKFQIM
jgi:hypothetical protein